MRVIFGVGTGYDRNGRIIGDVEAEQLEGIAVEYLSRLFGGVFKVDGKGGWVDESGKLIVERGVQFIAETENAKGGAMAMEAGAMLRKLFNQSSVVVSVSQSTLAYVSIEESKSCPVESAK